MISATRFQEKNSKLVEFATAASIMLQDLIQEVGLIWDGSNEQLDGEELDILMEQIRKTLSDYLTKQKHKAKPRKSGATKRKHVLTDEKYAYQEVKSNCMVQSLGNLSSHFVLYQSGKKPADWIHDHQPHHREGLLVLDPITNAIHSEHLELPTTMIELGLKPLKENCFSESSHIFLAIEKRNISALESLVAAGVDVNLGPSIEFIMLSDGNDSLVEYAYARGYLEEMEVLIKAGAKIRPILKKAMETKDRNAVEVISLSEYFHRTGSVGDEIVETAVRSGDMEGLKILLEAGASINNISRSYETVDRFTYAPHIKCALAEAIRNDRIEMMGILLQNGASIDWGIYGNAPWLAVISNREVCFHYLVNKGALQELSLTTNDNHQTFLGHALVYAAFKNNLEILKILIAHGVPVNHIAKRLTGRTEESWNRKTPLATAICGHSREAISVLLASGADPNLHGNYEPIPIIQCTSILDLETLQMLLDYGANPNADFRGSNVIIEIITRIEDQDQEKRAVPVIENLIKAGAKVDFQCGLSRRTALSYAAEGDAHQICRTLLRLGADPTIEDILGKSALHYVNDQTLRATLEHYIQLRTFQA